MPERSKDWINQALRDLKTAEAMAKTGSFEWSCFVAQQAAEKAQYPNSFESGSPYQYFTKKDAQDGLVCSRRIVEFCESLLA